jgi:hypothetical protein
MARKPYKYHYIYKTTCSVTGRYYIGMHSTFNLEDGYIGSGKRLWRSINKHGRNQHNTVILEFLENRQALKNRESQLITEDLLKDSMCMNLKVGGEGGFANKEHQVKCSSLGNQRFQEKLRNDPDFYKEVCKKRSDSNKKAHKLGIHKNWKTNNVSWVGKHHTAETKKKIQEAVKGKQVGSNNSQFGTKWMVHLENGAIKVSANDVSSYLSLGYVFGRKYRTQDIMSH